MSSKKGYYLVLWWPYSVRDNLKWPISDAIQKAKSYRICLRRLRKSSTSNEDNCLHYMGYDTTESHGNIVEDDTNVNKCYHMLRYLDIFSGLHGKFNV